jgi:hypothetical protein
MDHSSNYKLIVSGVSGKKIYEWSLRNISTKQDIQLSPPPLEVPIIGCITFLAVVERNYLLNNPHHFKPFIMLITRRMYVSIEFLSFYCNRLTRLGCICIQTNRILPCTPNVSISSFNNELLAKLNTRFHCQKLFTIPNSNVEITCP